MFYQSVGVLAFVFLHGSYMMVLPYAIRLGAMDAPMPRAADFSLVALF
jgi:hypothetical protein